MVQIEAAVPANSRYRRWRKPSEYWHVVHEILKKLSKTGP